MKAQIKYSVLFFLLCGTQGIFAVSSNQQNIESLIKTNQSVQNRKFDAYPKHWIGQYQNQPIHVIFTDISIQRVKGVYQLDGKETRFSATPQINIRPDVFKLIINDVNKPKGQLVFWLELKMPTQLIIDKSLRSNSSQTIEFKLKSK